MNVNQNQPPPQNQNQPRGTTVTTTTTTTTSKSLDNPLSTCMRRFNTNTSIATTTVNLDGTTQTYSHPYNPSTDPPPHAAETIVDQKLPSNAGIPPQTTTRYQPPSQPNAQPKPYQQQQVANPTITQTRPTPTHTPSGNILPARKPTPQQQSQFAAPPPPEPQSTAAGEDEDIRCTPSTSGGRTIPPRSDLRSPNGNNNEDANGLTPPLRSEKRRSMDGGLGVAPLNVQRSHSPVELPTPVSPTTTTTTAGVGGERSGTPNFSRPGVNANAGPTSPPPAVQNTTVVPDSTASAAVTTTQTSAPVGKRESFTATMKGLRGASEAIRGTVNSTIAKGMHDPVEEERMRAVREKGAADWKGSGLSEKFGERGHGLREGFREKAEGRMRLRRASRGEATGVHGSEGPGGLEAVEERSLRGQSPARS